LTRPAGGQARSADESERSEDMLAAARRRRFDAIVVWRADRLFRSV